MVVAYLAALHEAEEVDLVPGADGEHDARAACSQEVAVDRVGVLEEALEVPVPGEIPEVRVGEVQDVLSFDGVMEELDPFSELNYPFPVLLGGDDNLERRGLSIFRGRRRAV